MVLSLVKKLAFSISFLVSYNSFSSSFIEQDSHFVKLNSIDDLSYFEGSEVLLNYKNRFNERVILIKVIGNRLSLPKLDSIKWVEKSRVFTDIPFESDELEQGHHSVMQNEDVWPLLFSMNSPLPIAVTDDGVDLKHIEFKNAFAVNENEIEGNGIDDDDNGIIDDYYGANVLKKTNDLKPLYDHGTHITGIIAANGENEEGVKGSFFQTKVINVKLYDGSGWKAENILRAYKYSISRGAKIITTSYMIDNFVDDKVYLEALEYAYDQGAIVFNSGGNSNYLNPKRSKLERILLVPSTSFEEDVRDKKSKFSNYGYGMDISAPGENILSTVSNDKYKLMSGTSMASPNAAAVASMIWSMYPELTREQVVFRLKATADNINSNNLNYADQLGAGRVNSYRALIDNELALADIRKVKELDDYSLRVFLSNTIDSSKLESKIRLIGRDGKEASFTISNLMAYGANTIEIRSKQKLSKICRVEFDENDILDPFGRAVRGPGLENGEFDLKNCN